MWENTKEEAKNKNSKRKREQVEKAEIGVMRLEEHEEGGSKIVFFLFSDKLTRIKLSVIPHISSINYQELY